MSNFRDYFDKIYIVNLPERVDRRRAMENELKNIGIDPLSEKVTFFPAIKPSEQLAFPSIGVLGCYLSHLEIIRTARKENLQNVLVVEDDLAISKKFKSLEEKLVNELQKTAWDFVFIGYNPYRNLSIKHYEKKSHEDSLSMLSHIKYPPLGTHFYAVNYKAYDSLITFLEEILMKRSKLLYTDKNDLVDNLDGAYIDTAYYLFSSYNQNLNSFIVTPSLGWQRNSSSDISPSRIDKIPLLGFFANKIRIIISGVKKILE